MPKAARFLTLFLAVCIGTCVHVSAQAQTSTAKVSPAAAPPAAELPVGKIVERVLCTADPSQSYSLYLPTNYSKERTWPILYCFEPVARGLLPTEFYREAAERFGWIVVTSWNSQNGSLRLSLDAGSAMWRDTHERLRIDDRRVYTSGFSGGARVATLIAMSCGGCISGVIGCGAGFPQAVDPLDKQTPENLKFAYFATIGMEDYNFYELLELEPALVQKQVTHRIARFDGAHEWAPTSLLAEAVAWMEIEAIRAGTRPADAAFVDAIYAEGLAKARAHESAGRVYDAWMQFSSLQRQFTGLRDVTDAVTGVKALAGDRRVRDAAKNDREEVKQQNRLATEAATWARAREDRDIRVEAIAEFRRRINDLRTKSRAATDSAERRVSRRTINLLYANYYEGGLGAALSGNHAKAIELLEIATEIAPRWPGAHLALAGERFKAGERKQALDILGQGLTLLAERGVIRGAATQN